MCHKRFGFVSRADLRAYADKEIDRVLETVMGVERQIPSDLAERYHYLLSVRHGHKDHVYPPTFNFEIALIERIADLAAEVERLTDALNLANNERLALRTKTSQIDSLRGQIQQESRRLDFLIDWLGFHDDLEGSGIRDWEDNDDARKAIDEALGTDQQLQPKGEPR